MKKKVVQILLAVLTVASVGINVHLFTGYGKTVSAFNEVQTEIVTLDTSEKQFETDISDMQEEITSFSAEISNAEESVSALESDIQKLDSDIQALNSLQTETTGNEN